MNDLAEQPRLTYSQARAQLLSTINAQEPAALHWIDLHDEIERHDDQPPIPRRQPKEIRLGDIVEIDAAGNATLIAEGLPRRP